LLEQGGIFLNGETAQKMDLWGFEKHIFLGPSAGNQFAPSALDYPPSFNFSMKHCRTFLYQAKFRQEDSKGQ
jgi:hypothetical protein